MSGLFKNMGDISNLSSATSPAKASSGFMGKLGSMTSKIPGASSVRNLVKKATGTQKPAAPAPGAEGKAPGAEGKAPGSNGEEDESGFKIKVPTTKNINTFFHMFYSIGAFYCIVCFLLIFILSIMDAISFSGKLGNQISKLPYQKLLIEDSFDYETIRYVKTNTSSTEPFHVFYEEGLMASVYNTMSILAIVCAVQIGLIMSIMIYQQIYLQNQNFVPDTTICPRDVTTPCILCTLSTCASSNGMSFITEKLTERYTD
jgi:hypothetical protein